MVLTLGAAPSSTALQAVAFTGIARLALEPLRGVEPRQPRYEGGGSP